jgi:hypothetical protein
MVKPGDRVNFCLRTGEKRAVRVTAVRDRYELGSDRPAEKLVDVESGNGLHAIAVRVFAPGGQPAGLSHWAEPIEGGEDDGA